MHKVAPLHRHALRTLPSCEERRHEATIALTQRTARPDAAVCRHAHAVQQTGRHHVVQQGREVARGDGVLEVRSELRFREARGGAEYDLHLPRQRAKSGPVRAAAWQPPRHSGHVPSTRHSGI